MIEFEEQWDRYIKITSENRHIEYTGIKRIQIPYRKESHAGCCFCGNYVIGVPNSSRGVIAIDPVGGKYEEFGRTSIGTFKWTGVCEYNGLVYGLPRKSNDILVVDISKKTVKQVPLETDYRGEHHYGGVITNSGIIFQPPRNTNHILKINTETYKTEQIAIPGACGAMRYSSSVILKNGDVYMIPEYGYKLLILHTEDESVEVVDILLDSLVFGCVVGVDGNIYGFPKEGNGILKIDTNERRVSNVCENIGNPDCYGTVAGINGKLYGVPAGGKTIWEYDVIDQKAIDLFKIPEIGYAKCAGGSVTPSGGIVMMPCFGNVTYILDTDNKCNSNMSISKNVFLNTSY